MGSPIQLYFHAPCFDGVASAAIAAEYLSGNGARPIDLRTVDYGERERWLARSIGSNAAVVDFLYHPDALFFADHHETSFLNSAARRAFDDAADERADVFYDPSSPSCASLLVRVLRGRENFDVEPFESLARMADIVDSADYRSVEEAVFPISDAGRLRDSLALNPTPGYLVALVEALRSSPPDEVARRPLVNERCRRYQKLQDAALKQFGSTIRSAADGIVLFDYDASSGPVSRYAPYLFRPDARYSLGIMRTRTGAKITSMRNPWRSFKSVPLGRIFERFGGGGHERVASVQLPKDRASDAQALIGQIAEAIIAAGSGGWSARTV